MYTIESLDHYGRGITRVNNKIAFVKNALPLEKVDINTDIEKKNYIEASVTNYIETSKERREVKCPYYDLCGGCNTMHLNYEDQLKFKENKIKNIIDKYLNKKIKINDIVRSNLKYNYRNKVTFQVKDSIGFYNNSSHELIKIDNCLISNPLINKSIKYLNELELNKIESITCRVGSNELMIIIKTNYKDLNIDCLKDIANSIYLNIHNEFIHVFGEKNIYENIGKYKYIISPDSFFQINIDVCTKLYNKIKEYVKSDKKVLDLYCGTGSIGIFVSDKNSIIGIEKNKFAIEDANKNKSINNLNNTKFICGDSGKELKNLNYNPDVIILDPPRSGLNKETIDNVLKFNAKEIIYVSCDAMTLVRDLKLLSDFYQILELTPFDMFPNTYHVESVVLMSRIETIS